mgnify:CR=1 FL=1
MGTLVRFYSLEEQKILRQIEDDIKIKKMLYQQMENLRDYTILEAIEDIDIEIDELLSVLESKKNIGNVGKSNSLNRRLLVVSRS